MRMESRKRQLLIAVLRRHLLALKLKRKSWLRAPRSEEYSSWASTIDVNSVS